MYQGLHWGGRWGFHLIVCVVGIVVIPILQKRKWRPKKLEKEHCLFCLAYSRKRLTTWRRECISYRPEAALTLRVAADLAEVNTPCRSDA